MNNQMLTSIDDSSLDAVAGGVTVSASLTVPSPKEIVGGAVKAVGGVVEAAVGGLNSLFKMFGVSVSVK